MLEVFLTILVLVVFVGILKVIEKFRHSNPITDVQDSRIGRTISRIGHIIRNVITGAILSRLLSFTISLWLANTYFPEYLDGFSLFFIAIIVGAPTGLLAGISLTFISKIWMSYLLSVFLALIYPIGLEILLGDPPLNPFFLTLAFITVTITFPILLLFQKYAKNLDLGVA